MFFSPHFTLSCALVGIINIIILFRQTKRRRVENCVRSAKNLFEMHKVSRRLHHQNSWVHIIFFHRTSRSIRELSNLQRNRLNNKRLNESSNSRTRSRKIYYFMVRYIYKNILLLLFPRRDLIQLIKRMFLSIAMIYNSTTLCKTRSN